MKTTKIFAGMLVALAIAAPALAQTPDSAFAVSSGGVGLFRVNVDAGALFGGTYDGDVSGTGIPAEGAGTRMIWYPRKASFRAGTINGTQWDAANIGSYSFAAGQDVRASGDNATAFGLRSTAAQVSSFAVGEDNTASGAASVALGYHAHTNARQGSFVFSDRSSVDTVRAAVNHSATWRVLGGFRIFASTIVNSSSATGISVQSPTSTNVWNQANAVIATSTGAYLSSAGVWQDVSDVNRKHLFRDVAGEDVLIRLRALPIRSWSYRVEPDGVRHIGPTAQDFHAVFGMGSDNVTIAPIDEGGVALSAIKALDARTTGQESRISTLERDNAALQAENAELRARLDRIEQMLAQPKP
jgi:hypothetical protein